MARRTPAAAAWGRTAAMPSVIWDRETASAWPGDEPQTRTMRGAPRAAASSTQRRLSSIALARSAAEGEGKKPPGRGRRRTGPGPG